MASRQGRGTVIILFYVCYFLSGRGGLGPCGCCPLTRLSITRCLNFSSALIHLITFIAGMARQNLVLYWIFSFAILSSIWPICSIICAASLSLQGRLRASFIC